MEWVRWHLLGDLAIPELLPGGQSAADYALRLVRQLTLNLPLGTPQHERPQHLQPAARGFETDVLMLICQLLYRLWHDQQLKCS